MGSEELIGSLRKAGEEQVRLLREEAEREADSIRAEVRRRVEQLRAESAGIQSAEAEAAVATAVAAAQNRARSRRLLTEKALSERLFTIAVASLRRLREHGYQEVFEKLAREFPSSAWRTVTVNPADVSLAQKYFPGAGIVPDQTVTGGMDAATEGGAFRTVNTFEKRLERAWREMLPGLIRDVEREALHGTSSEP